jgi:hypothetical protein
LQPAAFLPLAAHNSKLAAIFGFYPVARSQQPAVFFLATRGSKLAAIFGFVLHPAACLFFWILKIYKGKNKSQLKRNRYLLKIY